jgi:hypothetical protein
MTQQGGVKTVALGGRPREGIIQAIGGVKGTNDFPFSYIYTAIAEIWGASNASLQNYWETTELADYTALSLYRSTNVVVNARNGYRQGDATNTPLQFVYEPADCRILYTPAMVIDETAVWKTVADSVWGGEAGDACVAGGFGVSKRSAVLDEQVRQPHSIRSDLDRRAILASFTVETASRQKKGGDSIMIL